jgi:hypothetical protein
MPKIHIEAIKAIGFVEEFKINFSYYKDTWTVFVCVKNDEVYGDCNTNVSTGQLSYFYLPIETRQKHFEQFKKVIYEARRARLHSIQNRE